MGISNKLITNTLSSHSINKYTIKTKKFRRLSYEFFKRIIDIAISVIMLVIVLPLIICISAAIKLEDRGPVIYKQKRITKNGKEFTMYKFRSMCENADDLLKDLLIYNEIKDGPEFKMKDDPRLTKVGRIIRKTSIDELPQLLNIIIGDMSIVGPRPPLKNEVDQYDSFQMSRLEVKQGLTCYWQCEGRNNLGFTRKLELDLKYINERSVITDFIILFKTIFAVIRMNGAK